MNQVNLRRQTLKPLLGWHGARLSVLALFLIALRASIVFTHLQPGQTQVLPGKKLVWGFWFMFVSCVWTTASCCF